MKFKVVGKRLILTDCSHEITKGENFFDAVKITIPRSHDSCDLSSLSFRFSEISEDGKAYAVQVLRQEKYDENYVYLRGDITSDFSEITGKVIFMLTGVNGENVVAKFQSVPYTIGNDISLASMPNETAAEQLFNQAQLEAQKAMNAAANAKKMLDEFTFDIASENTVGGVLAGGDISVSSNGNVAVQSVSGKTLGKSVPADAVFTDTVYTLPKATKETLGGVKVDGTSVIADKNGVISAVGGKDSCGNMILPAASTETLGGVKVDGKTITAAEDGTISASDSEAMKAEIAELKAIIGFTDEDIIGLHADFENNIFTRLGAAAGKNAGADFDIFPMYGGRKRCCVLDDGTIAAYCGDDDFAEDGSNGQVMVYQPKFYYKVVPLKLDPQTNGYGYHLHSANYYISSVPKRGFKLHPAFYNEDGDPTDYILFSAYEGSIFDASANSYLQNDEQTAEFSSDKLSSIAGVKPCSGKTQNLSRTNIEQLAQNRGKGWHGDTVKAESANQMLMAVEFAGFNTQDIAGRGVVAIKDDPSTENHSISTGSTFALGNSTGSLDGPEGQQSVSYRGMENPWGNIWKLVHGLNEYLDKNGVFHGYICSDFNFSENKGTDNYHDIGFTFSTKNGYVSAFGYSAECDWLFTASETQNSSTAQVGDYYWCKGTSLNEWRQALIGGSWFSGTNAGGFCWSFEIISDYRYRYFGSRLIFTPKSKML